MQLCVIATNAMMGKKFSPPLDLVMKMFEAVVLCGFLVQLTEFSFPSVINKPQRLAISTSGRTPPSTAPVTTQLQRLKCTVMLLKLINRRLAPS